MPDIQHVLDKVRKLLALASRANGPEAETALAQAQRLMDEYDLDRSKIGADEVNRVYSTQCLDRLSRITGLEESVVALLVEFFHVEAAWNSDRRELLLFGQPHHIKVAGYVYVVLCRQFREKWIATGRTVGSTDYFWGLSFTVSEQMAAGRGASTALIASESALKDAYRQTFPGWESGRVRPLQNIDVLAEGIRDGRDIRVHTPLSQARSACQLLKDNHADY